MAKLFVPAVPFLLLAVTGCSIDVRADGTVLREDKQFSVTGAPELTVDTFDGSIEVRSWDRNEVLVEIERRAGDAVAAEALEVRATQEGNRIRIEAPRPRVSREVIAIGARMGRSVNFVISVPRRLTLQARTGDGSILADALTGTLAFDTGDGSIRASDLQGTIRLRSGDGSIALTGADGSVDAESGDGSLQLQGRMDILRAQSGDGSVRIEVEPGSDPRDDWTITTGDGSISLRLPPAFNAWIEAQSGDGSINVSGDRNGVQYGDDRRNYRGQFGTGGTAVLSLQSGDGSISVIR